MRKKVQYYIASGPVIEIRRSWMSIDRDYKKPRGTRRVGASTEQKIRANEKGRIRTLIRAEQVSEQLDEQWLIFRNNDRLKRFLRCGRSRHSFRR